MTAVAEDHNLYRRAIQLALITIGYNIVEGLVSVWFGLDDETFACSVSASWFDALGTHGIAGFSMKEGRESFGKARGISYSCAGKCEGDP